MSHTASSSTEFTVAMGTHPHTWNNPEHAFDPAARTGRRALAMVAGRRRWVERMKAEGRKFPGGRKLGSRIVRGAKQAVVVQLPKQYRHMTFDEFVAAAKEALRQMQERFERTGRLNG
jgi:hypothetical protein